MIPLIITVAVYSIACGYFTAKIAEQKKYSFAIWLLLGTLFNVLALISIGFYDVNQFPDED